MSNYLNQKIKLRKNTLERVFTVLVIQSLEIINLICIFKKEETYFWGFKLQNTLKIYLLQNRFYY